MTLFPLWRVVNQFWRNSGSIELILNLTTELHRMATALDDKIAALQADVTANTAVISSAEQLLAGLSTQLTAALDAAKNAGATTEQLASLDALAEGLNASTTGLSAAITANTPAARSVDTNPVGVPTDAPPAADPVAPPVDAPTDVPSDVPSDVTPKSRKGSSSDS